MRDYGTKSYYTAPINQSPEYYARQGYKIFGKNQTVVEKIIDMRAETVALGLEFIIPTDGVFTSPYSPSRYSSDIKGRRPHEGIDIAKSAGAPIRATESGVITSVRASSQSVGYGTMVTIDHGNGFESLYAHMQHHPSKLPFKEGQRVKQGDVIGYMGDTGSGGTHLHFEIKKNGIAINPLNVLQQHIQPGQVFKSEYHLSRKQEINQMVQNRGLNGALNFADALALEMKKQTGQTIERHANGQYDFEKLFKQNGQNPSKMFNAPTRHAASLAFAKGDAFMGVTFLAEGISTRGGKIENFYYDPGSAGRNYKLINTHPGIVLTDRGKGFVAQLFKGTSLSPLIKEIAHATENRGSITPNMLRSKPLTIDDFSSMFNNIRDYYENSLLRAMTRAVRNSPEAQAFKKQHSNTRLSDKKIAEMIIEGLPDTSAGVLQHIVYKYGHFPKKMTQTLQHSIKAVLDPEHQQEHLANGSKYMTHFYRTSQGVVKSDPRASTIHRIFFAAGEKLSPEMALKISNGERLNEKELENAKLILKQAGVKGDLISENGLVNLPATPSEIIEGKGRYIQVPRKARVFYQEYGQVSNNPPVQSSISTPAVELDKIIQPATIEKTPKIKNEPNRERLDHGGMDWGNL